MPDTDLSTPSTAAWILKPNIGFTIALGESSMAEYVRDSQLYKIPGAVNYCNQVVLWRENFIPVVDLSLVLGQKALDATHIAVLVYQEYSGQKPKYVAIKLVSEVERVQVTDDASCEWPDDYPPEIRAIVESLFVHQEELVSVISVADLCNEGYRDYLAQLADIRA